jgi:hypothetical protein
MSRGQGSVRTTESGLPLGSDPKRSWMPVFVLAAIYLSWFGVLLWLATTQVGWK